MGSCIVEDKPESSEASDSQGRGALNEKLLERRHEMLKAHIYGVPLADIVKDLAKKYDVSTSFLYRDWRNRKSWIKEVLDIADSGTFFFEVVANHKEIQHLTTVEFSQADNSNARIGALRLLRDLNMDFQEMVVTKDLVERVEALEEQAAKQEKEGGRAGRWGGR